jgi:Xaa-Pro aminopeptidase
MLLEEAAAGPAGKQIQWDRIHELMPFGGIRIEDNVVVAEAGIRNLTREAFVTHEAFGTHETIGTHETFARNG